MMALLTRGHFFCPPPLACPTPAVSEKRPSLPLHNIRYVRWAPSPEHGDSDQRLARHGAVAGCGHCATCAPGRR